MSEQGITQRPVVALVNELLGLEVEQARVKARRDVLRAELHARAVEQYQADGMVPSWRSRGLGAVTLAAAEAEPVLTVADEPAWATWVAASHPESGEVVIRVRGDHPHLAQAMLDRLNEVLATGQNPSSVAAVAVEHVVVGNLLGHLASEGGVRWADDDQTTGVLVAPTGEVVPGIGVSRRQPYLSVRLDKEARERATAAAMGVRLEPDQPAPDLVGGDQGPGYWP